MSLFQSHFGLILSVCKSRVLAPVNDNLSIPFWSDFIFFHASTTALAATSFQSHFGLILSKERAVER